jgi:hypothetical protein
MRTGGLAHFGSVSDRMGPTVKANRLATLEAAKAEFEASWRQRLAWAKLGEVE